MHWDYWSVALAGSGRSAALLGQGSKIGELLCVVLQGPKVVHRSAYPAIEQSLIEGSFIMKCIKVMQVTDSLNAAGRERMAVNLANLLQRKGYRSYLCSTRSDGPLEDQVGTNVGRLRLARTYMVDFGALRRLIAFIRENQIDVLHAHGASLFIAGVASIFPPNPVVVWHDNDGNHGQKERPRWLYRLGATRVNAVITASEPLGEWSRTKLHVPAERVWYLPNFVQASERVEEPPELPGVKDSRIVCVAGLRRQKDHITLLRAMALVVQKFPKAHLLIVGGSSDAGYLEQIQKEIHDRALAQHGRMVRRRDPRRPLVRDDSPRQLVPGEQRRTKSPRRRTPSLG